MLWLCNKPTIADFFYFVILNLVENNLFHCISLEIPKQVRNDRGVRSDREPSAILKHCQL